MPSLLSRKAPVSTSGVSLNTRQAKNPSRALTPRVRKAVHAMVYEGLSRRDAASIAGLTDSALYQAFCKAAVVAYYNQQLDVLRTSERARNIHVGVELRDRSESGRVRLEAAKWLHGEHNSGGATVNVGVGVQVTPGYVIDLREDSQLKQLTAHVANPLGDKEDVEIK